MDDLWERIAYDLSGTCQMLSAVLDDYDALDLENHQPFLEYLDNEIFLCDGCGWWYPISEMSETQAYCNNCVEEGEEEDA